MDIYLAAALLMGLIRKQLIYIFLGSRASQECWDPSLLVLQLPYHNLVP